MCALVLAIASVVAAPSGGAAPSNIDGKWQWAGTAGWQRMTFDFKANGKTLNGTIHMGPGRTRTDEKIEDWEYFFEPASFPVLNGKVDGSTITFNQKIIRGAGSMPDELLKYTGRIEGDHIDFTRESFQRIRDPFALGDHRMEFTVRRGAGSLPGDVSHSSRSQSPQWLSNNTPKDVTRMSVFVDVADRSGMPVVNLAASHFQVFEDGKPLPIQNFFTPESPVNVMQLIDHSLSWFKDSAARTSSGYGLNEWRTLLQASSRFLDHLRPVDRIAIGDFESSVHMGMDWQSAHRNGQSQEIPLKLAQSSTGQKDVYGAVTSALKGFGSNTGRKIAILFTDGRDGRLSPRWLLSTPQGANGPGASGRTEGFRSEEVMDPLFGLIDEADTEEFNALVRMAAQSGIHFYFIAINADRDPEFGPALVGRRISGLFPGSNEAIDNYLMQARERMERLARVSGGKVFYGDRPDNAVSIYASLHRDLGLGFYSFDIEPTQMGDGATHRIEVRVDDPNLRVAQSVAGYR